MMDVFRLFRVGPKGVLHWRVQVKGKRMQRSTGETIEARAIRVARKAVGGLKLSSHGFKPMLTLRELAKEWLDLQEGAVSDHYHRAMAQFAKLHLHGLGSVPLNQIKSEDVKRARKAYLKPGRKWSSANQWLARLNALASWAIENGMLESIPWKVKRLKAQQRPRPILPLAKTRAWFAAVERAGGWQAATGVRLMRYLGLREAEALGSRWEWVDWDRGTYTPGKTKNRKAQPLKMSKALMRWLEPRRKTRGLMLGTEHHTGFFRTAMEKANQACETPGITPHRLRATCATVLARRMTLPEVQRFMRHAKPETTLRYIEEDTTLIASALEDVDGEIGE